MMNPAKLSLERALKLANERIWLFGRYLHQNPFDKYAASLEQHSHQHHHIHKQPLELAKVVNLEKLASLETSTIEEIWNRHFERQPLRLGWSIRANHFSLWFDRRARESPISIAPLLGTTYQKNYIFQYSEHRQNRIILITPLELYQRFGEAAPPMATIIGFPDLLESKGVGLFMGQFDGAELDRTTLMNLLRTESLVYTRDELYRCTWLLNKHPAQFDYITFIALLKSHNQLQHGQV